MLHADIQEKLICVWYKKSSFNRKFGFIYQLLPKLISRLSNRLIEDFDLSSFNGFYLNDRPIWRIALSECLSMHLTYSQWLTIKEMTNWLLLTYFHTVLEQKVISLLCIIKFLSLLCRLKFFWVIRVIKLYVIHIAMKVLIFK